MISVFSIKAAEDVAARDARPTPIPFHAIGSTEEIPPNAVWVDVLNPTEEEERKVEQRFDIDVPTHLDINYVEPTESLYAAKGARYLTAQIIPNADGAASLALVTFVLTGSSIISVRYQRSDAFELFSRRLADFDAETIQPETILAGLINTIVDRIAHSIEMTDQSLEAVSTSIFGINETAENHDRLFKKVLRAIGEQSKRISNIRKSLVSLERVLLFLLPEYQSARISVQLRDDVKATLRDLQSLEEHATFQSQKVQLLLDTTLGLINLEQSHIIKLFSVLAVIFMPPTVIASIYGMNFKYMPELDWRFGYPLALVLMVASSALLYMYFRWKHWL
jgi:magnesium transporter